MRRPRCVPILNLKDRVPRTFRGARNVNARVPRTCSGNISPGICTENICERAHNDHVSKFMDTFFFILTCMGQLLFAKLISKEEIEVNIIAHH